MAGTGTGMGDALGDIANRWGPLQSEDLELLAATFSDDQIQGALDKLAADQSVPAMMIIGFLTQRWAANSPAAPEQAAAGVKQFPEGELRNVALQNVIDVWGKDDPYAATTWIASMLN